MADNWDEDLELPHAVIDPLEWCDSCRWRQSAALGSTGYVPAKPCRGCKHSKWTRVVKTGYTEYWVYGGG